MYLNNNNMNMFSSYLLCIFLCWLLAFSSVASMGQRGKKQQRHNGRMSIHQHQGQESLRILMVLSVARATYSHFELHKELAKAMARQRNVEKVLLLGLTENPDENSAEESPDSKLSIWKRYRCGKAPRGECSTIANHSANPFANLWKERPDFGPKEGDGPKRTYIEFMLYNADLFAELDGLQFNVGAIEMTVQIDALPLTIFRLLPSIRRTIVTSSVPPTISHWPLLGFSDFIERIPGLSLAQIGDHEKIMNGEYVERFKEMNERWINGRIKIAQKTFNLMKEEFSKKTDISVNGVKFADIAEQLEDMATQFRGASLFLTNTQPMLEFPLVEKKVRKMWKRIGPPKMGFIGGIGLGGGGEEGKSSELDEKTRQIFDSSEKIVLVSFGSIVNFGMPSSNSEIEGRFFKIFERLPEVQFIWKYGEKKKEYEKLGANGNVHGKGWLDQQAILAQNNRNGNQKLGAFISHCGMNSLLESIRHGIPLICVPLFADQHNNAESLASRKLAKVIDIHAIKWGNKLVESIREVLHDDGYRANMAKAQKEFNKIRPEKMLEKELGLLDAELSAEK